MKILVTGAEGFVGKNLCAALDNLRTGKDRTRPGLQIEKVFPYDRSSDPNALGGWCRSADFVFHLAGVNRPERQEEFMEGNFGFTSTLLETLKTHGNTCPVMLASSVQASCEGRYDTEYGRSKKAGEELLFAYGRQTGAAVKVYRFPNLFGKWCRPNYNSAVATFCHNTANDLPITVNDPNTVLELAYIDDVVQELLDLLEGKGHTSDDGKFCCVPLTYRVSLGCIAGLLEQFRQQPQTLMLPDMPLGSFANKLYATYISYLPKSKVAYPLTTHGDLRGSFTELQTTPGYGQICESVIHPGITKGQHWHNTKWEIFMVVSGRARILQRKIGTKEIIKHEVTDREFKAVNILPGYTHSITNYSRTDDLVTVMWASEPFDPDRPDTFYEEVELP